MKSSEKIPTFTLFGETTHFPDIVHCEGFSARAPIHEWRISAHRHAQMAQLFLIKDGHISGNVDDVTVELSRDAFLFIPAQTVHEFVFQPDTEGHVISLPLSVMNAIGPSSQGILDTLSRPIDGKINPRLWTLSDLLINTIKDHSPFRTQEALGLSHAILAMIAKEAVADGRLQPRATDPRMTRLNQLLASHISDGWGASNYATALSLSTGHLSRLCRSASGLGATAYIEQYIIQEACRMLAFTQLPVSEVGYRVGFGDPSYFSKRFRAARAQTPSEYRTQFMN